MTEKCRTEISELITKEILQCLGLEWGDQTFHQRFDEIVIPICDILDVHREFPFWTLQAHSARSALDQAGINQLGGVLGAIEPRLYYGAEAAQVMQIALGLKHSPSKFVIEPGSERTNIYLTPFMQLTTNHDTLCKPNGHLIASPEEIVKVLSPDHQLLREDRIQLESPLETAKRLKQLSNQWRIAVL
jgi:hypothetical protein